MYNIIQLTSKSLDELQEVAKEMGLKGTGSLDRQDLIYRILDEQAIMGSKRKAAAEEERNERRQRTRINKKEVANKVYSADKDKAEKINDTPKIVTTPVVSEEPKAMSQELTANSQELTANSQQPTAKSQPPRNVAVSPRHSRHSPHRLRQRPQAPSKR